MLYTAEILSVSSQKPSPTDTTSDLLVQLDRICMLSEFLKPCLGCWCPKVLPNTLLPPFRCPWKALVACLLHLNPCLVLGMVKVKNKPAVKKLFVKFHARFGNLRLGLQPSAASCCVSSQGCFCNCLLEFLETGRMAAKCYFVK